MALRPLPSRSAEETAGPGTRSKPSPCQCMRSPAEKSRLGRSAGGAARAASSRADPMSCASGRGTRKYGTRTHRRPTRPAGSLRPAPFVHQQPLVELRVVVGDGPGVVAGFGVDGELHLV